MSHHLYLVALRVLHISSCQHNRPSTNASSFDKVMPHRNDDDAYIQLRLPVTVLVFTGITAGQDAKNHMRIRKRRATGIGEQAVASKQPSS